MRKMMNFKSLLLASFAVLSSLLTAQERLTGFYVPSQAFPTRGDSVLSLPFFDDFSGSSMYPDAALWTDSNVLVNNGFAVCSPTMHVATFDALDSHAEVYSNANSTSFVADYLTSRPIRLDSVFGPSPRALSAADSVFVSFYYQPQGNGDSPEENDSLVLEFGVENGNGTIKWHHAWSTRGMSLAEMMADTTHNGECFRPVSVAITDSVYFTERFYFRFKNYASMVGSMYPNNRGNCDNWNIALVSLDCGRKAGDLSLPGVAFAAQRPSFLKRYSSLPYRQYRYNPTACIAEDARAYVSNLDSIAHTLTCTYEVNQIGGTHSWTDANPQTITINPYQTCGLDTILFETGLFYADDEADTASFEIKFIINDGTLADTMTMIQGFYDYYAYDDGIPEMGYGLEPVGSAFAVQFRAFAADTLMGVSILFNHTFNDANAMFFNIVVWRDDYGKPGEELYRMENLYVDWSENPYEFVYYQLDSPVALIGNFYVGIEQLGTGIINIGFDASNDNRKYNFMNCDGTWLNSSFNGSIMLRPVMSCGAFSGIDERMTDNVSIFPNPVSDLLSVYGIEVEQTVVYDLAGREMVRFGRTNILSLVSLEPGSYILRITDSSATDHLKKIIVTR